MSPDSLPAADPAAAASLSPSPHRAIRSYVRRAGRTTEAQARALAVLGPKFVLPFENRCSDLTQLFGRAAPTILEIGFGMGDATAQIAQLRPEDNFIGCEVHEPGIGALLKHMQERHLSNLRIIPHDAVEVLRSMIPAASLAGVHIFFPDPWHKKKHHKRRLIQTPFIDELTARMERGAYLHCATDWQPYAEQMLAVLSAHPQWANTTTGYADKPAYRPLTKFENRGLRLGHGVWDLVFKRL